MTLIGLFAAVILYTVWQAVRIRRELDRIRRAGDALDAKTAELERYLAAHKAAPATADLSHRAHTCPV